MVPINQNLVDLIWEDKQLAKVNTLIIHEEKWHGIPTKDKIIKLGVKIIEKKALGIITTKLDEIAW